MQIAEGACYLCDVELCSELREGPFFLQMEKKLQPQRIHYIKPQLRLQVLWHSKDKQINQAQKKEHLL